MTIGTTASTPKAGRPPSMARMLARYLAPQRGWAALMAALLLIATGMQLLVPQLLRQFIDGALGSTPAAELTRLALAFLGIALLTQLLNAVATYVAASVGWTATNLLREELTDHTLGLDMVFHNERTPGEMIERIDGDVTALSNFLSVFSVRVFGGALLLVGILVALWIQNLAMGALLTAFVVLQLVVLSRTRRAGVPATRLEREANAKLFGFIEERLQGIDDLRANGAGPFVLHRFGDVMRAVYHDTRRAWMLRSVVWLSSYGLVIVGTAVTVGASIVLVGRGELSVGGAYMVFQYLLMLQTPIEQITQQLQELQKAGAGVERVGELLALTSALPNTGEELLPAGALGVVFDRVGFHYPDVSRDRATLHDVSFELAPGTKVGLLGRTGSGKSTLTRLLFRLYDPSSGVMRLGGIDARRADLRALRARVGLVSQEVQLFRGTLRNNLTFFDDSVTDARVMEVLGELDMLGWLERLEQGLDTPIDSGGRNLSAGEAQLIAFARVFLLDPGLVVLDEPSSRLDPATEARLGVAMERLLAGRTAVIIAHRLETVERVDEIIVMEGGRVVEHGHRRDLARDPASRYARLRHAALGRDGNLGRTGADSGLLEELA